MKILCAAVVGMGLMVGTFGLLVAPAAAQMSPQPFPPQRQPAGQLGRPGQDQPPTTLPDPTIAQRQARLRNNDRQQRLVADTDKLLTLATELKQDVSKTNQDVLSVDVIKKADEIEKLAHSVKERMKG
jgi:hypothetical protein